MSTVLEKTPGYSELIQIPAFSIFWAGRIVSGLGDILFTMATMWYVLSTTNSALKTALVPLVPMLSFIILAVPLGTVADRLPKKVILVGSDVISGVIVGCVYLLMIWHHASAVEIYTANLLLSVAGMLFSPAEQAALPNILPDRERQLAPANGLLSATSQAITLLGYGVGGLIVAWLHPGNAVLLDGISFFLSAISFVLLSIPALRAKASQGVLGFLRDSSEGIRFIWRKRTLRVLVCFGAIVNMTGAPIQIFTSVFSKEVLHAGVAGYGYLEAAAAAGGLVASLLSGKLAHRLRLWQWMTVSFLTGGLSLFFMALFPSLWLAIALFGIATAGSSLLNIPLATSLQLLAPEDMRGRVMSSFGLFFSSANPVGLIAGGWLINVLGARFLFSIVGVLGGISGIISLFFRTFRDDDELNRGFDSSTSA
ncbi:MFS transporter [Alicyclobacillus fodiniaquatilis]|uniref:MFS transporter n=1 Tax=Alicyclobacillus fodiniaquatilis TaxID=1661150 RepID=A0ABW4JHA8_9BACL